MNVPGAEPRPLQPGRHKLSRDEVRASQRSRLMQAMEELVAEVGYERASVPKVVQRARVTGRTFYELFHDKADCFIAVSQARGDELRGLIDAYVAVVEQADDPIQAFDTGLAAYLEWWMQQPEGARAFFVDLPAVGERAFAARDSRTVLFSAALARVGNALRARAGVDGPVVDSDATAAAVLALELVAREVRNGRIEQLRELHPALRRVLFILLVGRPDPA